MSIDYRLGLDLGTNSLGWALWELDENGPTEILDMGVRLFPDGREPGKGGVIGDPLAVKRRDARSMRRRRDRFLQRKRALINAIIREKLWPEDIEVRLPYSKLNPYTLRSKAIYEKLEPHELGRVLLHLCQRRGFKSNRKDQSKEEEKGKNKTRIKALNQAINESGYQTLGDYLNAQKKQGARFRDDSEFYPDRQHYIEEFNLIKRTQEPNFPYLNWKLFSDILFFQRPLKPQKKGSCRYYQDQERAHKSLPSTHRFRILQELSNLRIIGSHGESIGLSREEFELVYNQLENQKTLTFTKLKNLLKTDGRFNLEDGKRDKLLGNTTSCDMRKPEFFGILWDEFNDEIQDEIVWEIMEAEEDEELRDYFHNFTLSESQIENLVEVTFPTGIARYSALLHRECVRIMHRDFIGYSDALASLGFDHRASEGQGDMPTLPYYGKALPESCIIRDDPNQNESERIYGKIGNPTVHIALNQLRKVVNALIEEYGKPAEIVVELSRDLKLGRQQISKILSEQKQNQKRNETLDKELGEIHKLAYPSRADREKLKYYKELLIENVGAHCPYCGKIIRAEELFDGHIEVEHILPFSRTLDDGRNNKTLAHRSCNQFKREKSPFEAFGNSPDGYNWEEIVARTDKLPGAKKWRFRQDAMDRFEDAESGFIQRQLTDNAYIARIAKRYLTTICPPNKIWGVAGRQTAVLRRKWDLNSILSKDGNEKNRSDHRHHAVDAAVIGLTDRSMIQSIARANKKGEGDLDRFTFKVPPFPGGDEGKKKLAECTKKILPSFKPDHGLQGRFFKETAYGKIKKALEIETSTISENLISMIVPVRIRNEFQNIIEKKGFRNARKEIQGKYPKLRVLQELWTTSKPITSIDESDLENPSYGKNTKGPSDFELRKKIKRYIQVHPGQKIDKVMEQYGKDFGIRHVRYIPKNQEITPITSSPGKGYELDDYAYVDIWQLPVSEEGKIKYEGIFASRLEASQIKRRQMLERRPHPCARKIMTLYKQDTIALKEEDGWKYFQIAGFSTTQGKLDIQPIYRNSTEWFEKVNHSSLPCLYPETRIQNYKAINALWQNNTIRKISVHYNGTVR